MMPLPSPLAAAADSSRAAEAAAAAVDARRSGAMHTAARKRAALALAVRHHAPALGITVRALCEHVAGQMSLSYATVRKELYEYPHRADVLAACLDHLGNLAADRGTNGAAPPSIRAAA